MSGRILCEVYHRLHKRRNSSKTSRLLTTVVRKLREDLEKLPEDTGIDEYTDMPVEGFGTALLSGYGWNKDRGIGRNAKEQMCPTSPMAIFCILLPALELVARGSDGFLPSAGSVGFFVVVVSEQENMDDLTKLPFKN
ncbi:protein MOS2 [Abeliophyllum distichum]|uniref:Protein MOS2 n=1 Tax=Abeliophyllum distichum TaxID=126358 RepID=A0ABD1Q4W4_9LAMI